jgi:hypothetical protein
MMRILAALSRPQINATAIQFAHGAMLLLSNQLATPSRMPRDFHQLFSVALLLKLNQKKTQKMMRILQRLSSVSGSII